MTYEISCLHAGQPDCEFLIRSEDESEVIRVALRHGREVHGYDDLTREDVRELMYEPE